MLPLTFGRKSAVMLLSASLAMLGVAGAAVADHVAGHDSAAVAQQQNGSFTTTQFAGPKANSGTATLSHQDGKRVLTWSDDFKIPDTPAPHWQVVDSSGNTYLLQRLLVKGDKQNRSIVVPSYVKDVAKVQIWCAYAEVVLGEASFASAVN